MTQKTHIIIAVAMAALVAAVAGLAAPGTAEAQDIELRRVDRATVRVIGIAGARTARVRGQQTGVDRLPALPSAGHGTGIVVGTEGLVVTARHVVEGMDVLAVVHPGQNRGVPARVVYVDPDHDVAVLQIPGPIESFIAMPPTDPALRMGGRVSASGYPIDHRERYPAAVSGVISRQNNDGNLQLAIGVNPGNSGGPVVDEEERLIGILSRRGRPEAGVESIGLVEPLRFVRETYRQAVAMLGDPHPSFDEDDRRIAQLLTDHVRTSDEQPIYEQTSVALISLAAHSPDTPEEAAMIAGHAWNMSLALLEARGGTDPSQLSGSDRQTAEELLAIALRLARQVDGRAPYIRVRYPVIRSILVNEGRPYLVSR